MKTILGVLALMFSLNAFAAFPTELKGLTEADVTPANLGKIIDLMAAKPSQYIQLGPDVLRQLRLVLGNVENINKLTSDQAKKLQDFISTYAKKMSAQVTQNPEADLEAQLLGQALTLDATNRALGARLTEAGKSEKVAAANTKTAGLSSDFLLGKLSNVESQMDLNTVINYLNNQTLLGKMLQKNLERLPRNQNFCQAILRCDKKETKPIDLKGMFDAPVTH